VGRAARSRRWIGCTAQGGIFWVEGLRIAHGYKLDNATRLVLTWKWRSQNA